MCLGNRVLPEGGAASFSAQNVLLGAFMACHISKRIQLFLCLSDCPARGTYLQDQRNGSSLASSSGTYAKEWHHNKVCILRQTWRTSVRGEPHILAGLCAYLVQHVPGYFGQHWLQETSTPILGRDP